MTELGQTVLPSLVLLADLFFVFLLLAALFGKNWGNNLVLWIGKRAILFGLLTSLSAVLGSLFYSNVLGYPPCELCWWHRILLYPQFVLFLTALKSKDRRVFVYSWRLSVLAALLASYHQYTNLGGSSLLACTQTGGECSRLYVLSFGFVTIPMMSLTIAAYLLFLAWANRQYENSNA